MDEIIDKIEKIMLENSIDVNTYTPYKDRPNYIELKLYDDFENSQYVFIKAKYFDVKSENFVYDFEVAQKDNFGDIIEFTNFVDFYKTNKK